MKNLIIALSLLTLGAGTVAAKPHKAAHARKAKAKKHKSAKRTPKAKHASERELLKPAFLAKA